MQKKYIVILGLIIIATLFVFFVGYTSIINNGDPKIQVIKTDLKIKSFTAKDLSGNEVKLDTSNSIHIYEVFSSWCIPCKESVPEILAFSKKHDDLKLTGIAFRDVNFEIEKFQKEYGEFNQTIMANGSVENAFSIRSVPQTLFTRSVKILYRVYGAASESDFEKVLALVEGEKSSS